MAWFAAKSLSLWQTNVPSILLRMLAVLGALFVLEALVSRTASFSDDDYVPFDRSRYTYAYENETSPLNPDVIEQETMSGAVGYTNGGTGTKTIIASCLKGGENSTKWIHDLLPDWQAAVYVVDDPKRKLTVARNKGREASVYLTYIIKHYHNLPDYMVFIHGRRYQWHSDDPMYDTYPGIADLSLSYLQDVGYASLRCTWKPGCPEFLTPDPSLNDGFFHINGLYGRAFQKFFPHEPVPAKVGAPCCAQFAVSRDQVHLRSLADYKRYRKWLWTNPENSMKTGYVMEYMWHLIFGKPAVYCQQSAKECFCQKWKLCALNCPTQGYCKGRYIQRPYNKSLPVDWPNVGQGEFGLPKQGWWRHVEK